jgi:carbamate kinase
MRVVLALGGNALIRRGEPMDASLQRRNLGQVAGALASLARQHEVVITHGNGPQVGLLALQAAAYKDVAPYPLDILGAESEGMIGYLIEQALSAELPGREIATVLTQVEVDAPDPAFAAPSKPIGPVYREMEMRALAARTDWRFCKDGPGFRRVVPSPEPRRIREINVIRRLVDAGVLVVCARGGGIPVTVTAGGGLRGVEAVIDKDLAAALLAEELGAERCCF